MITFTDLSGMPISIRANSIAAFTAASDGTSIFLESGYEIIVSESYSKVEAELLTSMHK